MNIGQVLEDPSVLAKAKVLGFNVATPVFNGADEDDIAVTLEIANDFTNTSWEDFEAEWKDRVMVMLIEFLRENQDKTFFKIGKGVPIDSTGKVRLRDRRTGEEFDSRIYDRIHCIT